MFPLCNREFRLVRVGLARAACPPEVMGMAENLSAIPAIVVLKNPGKMGKISATGYVPSGIVAAGARRRQHLLERGYPRGWVYAEDGSIEIRADDEIGCNELLEKLRRLVCDKVMGPDTSSGPGKAWPYVVEVYPFENYLIYSYNGDMYRQYFDLDPVAKDVALRGGPVKVNQRFVNSGEAKEIMPRSDTGIPYSWAHTAGNTQSFSTGGKNSELATSVVRNWANIEEAVAMYLSYCRNRKNTTQMTPTFAPVTLTPDHKVYNALVAAGVDPFDFVVWSAEARYKKTKSHGGDEVPMAQHAYVGDPKDSSTWHLPTDTPGRAKAALARLNQTKGIPKSAKAGVLTKIRKAAKHHGVDVSDKATPGQKKWVGHKVAAEGVVA